MDGRCSRNDLAKGEYLFISPVFTYNESGHVVQIINAALTNTPALGWDGEVMLAAASLLAAGSTSKVPPQWMNHSNAFAGC
ncbi:phage protease [Serratia ureilytica]